MRNRKVSYFKGRGAHSLRLGCMGIGHLDWGGAARDQFVRTFDGHAKWRRRRSGLRHDAALSGETGREEQLRAERAIGPERNA